MAALLYVGGLSALTAQTGGAVYQLRRMKSRFVHVLVEERRMPRAAPWIRIHRTSWLEPGDVSERDDGLRVLTPLRLLFELAACLPRQAFIDAAEDMWHHRLVEPSQAAIYLAEVRRQGRTGVAKFEEWVLQAHERTVATMSGLEADLINALVGSGLPEPARQFPLRLLTGQTIHIDVAFADVQLGVEPGASWWHGGDARMRADYIRDSRCAAVGWHIIRFDDEQLNDPRGCAEQVRLAYRARLHLLRAGNSPASGAGLRPRHSG
jgi:hypothetical protein